MRLKKSPKEATRIIDGLIQEGMKIMDLIRSEDWDQHKNPLILNEEDYEELKAGENNPTNLDDLEFFSNQLNEWSKICLKEIEDIFMDAAPIFRFRNASVIVSDQIKYLREYFGLESSLEPKLNVLAEYYDELRYFVRSPLIYIPKKAQIWFYDFVVQLEPDSNEAGLCAYLFDFGIGELKDFDAIYAHIKGESLDEQDKWPKGWKTTLNSAYDGINKKSNKNIGFGVLSKIKNQFCVNFPNRFIQGLA